MRADVMSEMCLKLLEPYCSEELNKAVEVSKDTIQERSRMRANFPGAAFLPGKIPNLPGRAPHSPGKSGKNFPIVEVFRVSVS